MYEAELTQLAVFRSRSPSGSWIFLHFLQTQEDKSVMVLIFLYHEYHIVINYCNFLELLKIPLYPEQAHSVSSCIFICAKSGIAISFSLGYRLSLANLLRDHHPLL